VEDLVALVGDDADELLPVVTKVLTTTATSAVR
jgi:hypothetical protein